jgi:hypothetical protein
MEKGEFELWHTPSSIEGMKNTKTIYRIMGISGIATLALALMSGCVVRPYGGVAVEAPAPVVTVGVPDDYIWDGYEYVGIIGDQYYYLGPGNVWIVCDPVRLARFHDYVRVHPDWHAHVTVNVRYRSDAHGHYQPRHDARPEKRDDHDHGY